MTQKEVIERFCELQSKVAQMQGFSHAADCFCQGVHSNDDYRNEGKALEYIEMAVELRMLQEKGARFRLALFVARVEVLLGAIKRALI